MQTVTALRPFRFLFIALLSAMLTGCMGPRPFLASKVRSYQPTEEELKSIQYYLSREVIFSANFRHKGEGKKTLASGEGSFEETFLSEERVIKLSKGTPGVCVAATQSRIEVDFGNKVILVFESRAPAKYYFLASSALLIDGLMYRRQTHNSAYLQAKASFAVNVIERRGKHAAPGRTVEEVEE